MPSTKTRVVCPHCGRSIALRSDGQGIARHGPQRFANYKPRPGCPGTGLTPVNGDLTAKHMAFLNHCWRTGDALPVARMLCVEYCSPDLAANGVGVDAVVTFLIDHAREFIVKAVRDYRSGVMV